MNERSRRLLIPLQITKWHFDGLVISEMARWNLKDRQSPGLCLSNIYFSYSVFIYLKWSLYCQSKDKMPIASLYLIGYVLVITYDFTIPKISLFTTMNMLKCFSAQWVGWTTDIYHNGLNKHRMTLPFPHLSFITCSYPLYWKSDDVWKFVDDKSHHSNSRSKRRWICHA